MPKNIVFRYLWKRRMTLSEKNSSFKKGQKVDISTEIMSEKIVFGYLWKKKNDFKWKKSKFLVGVFFTEIMSERMVFSYSGWKTNKDKKWQGPKNGHFLKGLVHGFCSKIELSLIAVFHKHHIRKHRLWYCKKKRMILSGKQIKF